MICYTNRHILYFTVLTTEGSQIIPSQMEMHWLSPIVCLVETEAESVTDPIFRITSKWV